MSVSPIILLLLTVVGQAASPTQLDEKQTSQLLERYHQQQAESYEFYLDEPRQQKLELVEKPVLRWTAEGNYGAVWVWTRLGRPEVVGCLGCYTNAGTRRGFHEFHSLTLKPLQKAEVGNVRIWESRAPGVVPTLFDDAPEPAAGDKLRLIQMRSLAREFSAEMRAGTQTHILRMSTAPLFRFSSTNPEVLDGALFSFLWDGGTDPEVLLMIEARQTRGRMQWHYSPARFTWREVSLRHGDKEVWRVEQHKEFHTGQILRDGYVTCETGPLNLESVKTELNTK